MNPGRPRLSLGRLANHRGETMAKAKHETAVERLNDSLEAAQKAATALRGDIGAGGRDLLRDVERMISAARRDAAKLGHSVRDDLSELHKSIAGHSNGNKTAT